MNTVFQNSPRRLVLASHNAGKLLELSELLSELSIEVLPASAFAIPEPEETQLTFVENALLKARHASRISGLPALADDSGLCVNALHGAPGLYSARYAGPKAQSGDNIAKLLRALEGLTDDQRGAHFHCALALIRHPEDPAPLIAEGQWFGQILSHPRGDAGFGYDPVFLDLASGRSAAELSRTEKAAISHRGRALSHLKQALTSHPL